jgi:serine/threonine protein kinase
VGNVTITAAVKALKVVDSAARSELLKEAALTALFDHKNVVSIIGVVSAPQFMPALLVLEYCEHGECCSIRTIPTTTNCRSGVDCWHYCHQQVHSLCVCLIPVLGTLIQHVLGKKATDLPTAMLLTYCHDVATGLRYLSSRRIIHRDVAARNVSGMRGPWPCFGSRSEEDNVPSQDSTVLFHVHTLVGVPFHVRWWLTRLLPINLQVLLDSACTCKISDFGMSAALSKGDETSDYAANCECGFWCGGWVGWWLLFVLFGFLIAVYARTFQMCGWKGSSQCGGHRYVATHTFVFTTFLGCPCTAW